MAESKQTTALITDDKDRIKRALLDPEALTELLAPMKAKVDEKGRTVDTSKGRDEIRSLAYSISRDKTTVDNVGKDEVAVIKKEIAKYDAARKVARNTIEGYQHEVRAPLTAWEKLRADAEKSIKDMIVFGRYPGDGVREIQTVIKRLEAVDVVNYPEEMQARATDVRDEALASAKGILGRVQKANEEARELKQLREDKIASEAKLEKERMIKVAAEQATKKAQDKAKQDIQDANDRADKIVRDAQLAERKRIADLARAELELEANVENDRLDRLAEEQRQQEERDARTRNATHRADIQNQAWISLTNAVPTIEATAAVAVIRAITDGNVKHIEIKF